MEIKLVDLVRAAGFKDTEYQYCIKALSSSEKHKGKMSRTAFKGDIIEGDMQELINDLQILVKEQKKNDAEAIKKEQEKVKQANQELEKQLKSYDIKPLFEFSGSRGRFLKVYKDRVMIKVDATAGSFFTGNLTDGEKTIFYHDCIGVQFKEAGAIIGYLQLETASGLMNNNDSNFFNENTFTFEGKGDMNKKMRKLAEFITEQVAKHKQIPVLQNNYSAADEIKKYKDLLDSGAITQDEYESKKVELLYQ